MNFLLDMIGLYVLICSFGAFISILTFVKDVSKWHRAEKKVHVVPSALEDEKESEVKDDERDNSDTPYNDTANGGQPTTSAVLPAWLQS
ncbi:MAG: hypothetical protein IKW87_09615 [Ruminococcus sp.]|nr:hypothetical protein [Ruminococcus sp.]